MDTEQIRSRFPALQERPDVLFFDNPAGTQVPDEVITGYTDYLRCDNANEGGYFATSQATDEVIGRARREAAEFLGAASPEEIVFGPNMTTLTFGLSHALARMLGPGDEVVTTRLEHDANVAPWLALEDRGVTVRWIDIHPENATLDLESAEQVIGPRTRLVALGYASNALGTVNDVRRIVDMAHAHGAWTFVDAVHYGPHGPIDVRALGCDLLACSPYKFFGPHLGVLWGRYDVLDTIPASHVRPAGDHPPDSWETGTASHEALSALLGTFSYLRSLGDGPDNRSRLVDALTQIQTYERTLSECLIGGLCDIPGVTVYGISEPPYEHRVPTVSFTVSGHDPDEVSQRLGAQGIFSWSGNHYAVEPLGRLGLDATNRVGLVHYNTPAEVDRFLQAVEDIAATPPS